MLDLGAPAGVTDALRARGYPAPATLAKGEVDGTGYEISELLDGEPVEELTRARARGDGRHLDETRARLDRLRRIADNARSVDVARTDVVHYDFSPYNILASGDRITGVVDWDGATSGDAAFDLVTLAAYTYDFGVRDELLAAAAASTDPRALALYAAHMVLRQVDWSIRHHDEGTIEWFLGIGTGLLARVEP